MRHDRRQHDNSAATSLTASSPVTPPTQPCQTPIRGSKILLPHSSSCPRPIADRCTPIRWAENFRGTNSKKRAGQSPKNFPTNKIFLPKIPGLGAEIFHPFNSLRPAQLNRFPEKIPKKTAGFRGRKILWVGRFSKPQTGGPNNSEHALRFLPVVTKTCFGGWAPKNRRIQSGNRTSGYA